jgi:hypothetical protein
MSTKLKEAFIATELPVGHLDAYKEGAAYGYLLAKRQMVEALDIQIEHLKLHLDERHTAIQNLEGARNYVRNVMLFKKD